MGGNGKCSDLPDLAVSEPAALPDLAASDLSDFPDEVVSALPDFPEEEGYGPEGRAVAEGLAEAEGRDVGLAVAEGLAEAEGRDVGGIGKRSDLPDLAEDPDPDPAALPDLAVASDAASDAPEDRVVSALPDFPEGGSWRCDDSGSRAHSVTSSQSSLSHEAYSASRWALERRSWTEYVFGRNHSGLVYPRSGYQPTPCENTRAAAGEARRERPSVANGRRMSTPRCRAVSKQRRLRAFRLHISGNVAF